VDIGRHDDCLTRRESQRLLQPLGRVEQFVDDEVGALR
jgi:hypothetical protein